MGAVYKMVELEISGIKRFTAKIQRGQADPSRSQTDFPRRGPRRGGAFGRVRQGHALLQPVILGGQLVEPLPSVEQARARAAAALAKLPEHLRQWRRASPGR